MEQRKSIKETLMKRDGTSAEEADTMVSEAHVEFLYYLDNGDMDGAYNICEEFFGLEPDYIDEFI